jgi:hypothetical protein
VNTPLGVSPEQPASPGARRASERNPMFIGIGTIIVIVIIVLVVMMLRRR